MSILASTQTVGTAWGACGRLTPWTPYFQPLPAMFELSGAAGHSKSSVAGPGGDRQSQGETPQDNDARIETGRHLVDIWWTLLNFVGRLKLICLEASATIRTLCTFKARRSSREAGILLWQLCNSNWQCLGHVTLSQTELRR